MVTVIPIAETGGPLRHGARVHGANRRPWISLALCASLITGCDQSKQDAAPAPGVPAESRAAAGRPAAPAAPSPAVPQPFKPSGPPLNSVESLVAPVALYPDPLLAELLVAATYPVEIVEAGRWLGMNPDPATVKDKGWDPSVQRLTQVPSVVRMMSDHLEWTTALGNAFLEDPESVLGAVQTLRGRAVASGFLQDTPQQKVERREVEVKTPPSTPEEREATPAVVRQEVVTIQPAQQDTLYVPQYSPEVAYSAPLAPPPATAPYPAQTYYPAYTPATTTSADASTAKPWLTFGAGALVGGLLTWGIMELADDDDWDDNGYWGGYYGGGPYRVVHHYGNSVCYRGNCWDGGGYGARGYRGDVNVSRDVEISGNEFSRDRTFRMNELQRRHQAWQHDPDHRRGLRYSGKAQERLGEIRQSGLAGERRSGLGAVADRARGIDEGAIRPAGLPTRKPLSSDEIRGRLAQQEPGHPKPGDRRERREQAGSRLAEAGRDGAFAGARETGGQVRRELQRGQQSRQTTPRAGADRTGSAAARVQQRPGAVSPRPTTGQQFKQRPHAATAGAGQQRIDQARRQEMARPAAFGGARDGGRAKDFSRRGAASRSGMHAQRAAHPDFGGQRAGGTSSRGGGQGRGGGGRFGRR